jgi:hypothetical protein
MPCYTVNLINVSFKTQNIKLLESAITALKWEYHINTNTNTITVYAPGGTVYVNMATQTATGRDQNDINALKQSYSKAAVKKAALDKGWTLDQWKDTAGIKKTIAIKY